MKRAFDFSCAFLALVFFGPLLLFTAVLTRVSLGSPILFVQERPGYRARLFRIYKFRTMADRCDPWGQLLPDEARLTPFGRWMRKWSLDELPEFFNVLKADMSLVGPRPLLPQYLPLYSPEQARRHEVKPGLTGWAQINGRNAISWEEKFALDVWYVDNRSFLLDLKILLLTVWKVLKGQGISAAGEATMPEFRGSGPSERS